MELGHYSPHPTSGPATHPLLANEKSQPSTLDTPPFSAFHVSLALWTAGWASLGVQGVIPKFDNISTGEVEIGGFLKVPGS